MMKSKNKYLLNKRLKILKFAKIIVAENGLTSKTLKNISKKYDLDIHELNLLFPDGKNDLLKFKLLIIPAFLPAFKSDTTIS